MTNPTMCGGFASDTIAWPIDGEENENCHHPVCLLLGRQSLFYITLKGCQDVLAVLTKRRGRSIISSAKKSSSSWSLIGYVTFPRFASRCVLCDDRRETQTQRTKTWAEAVATRVETQAHHDHACSQVPQAGSGPQVTRRICRLLHLACTVYHVGAIRPTCRNISRYRQDG